MHNETPLERYVRGMRIERFQEALKHSEYFVEPLRSCDSGNMQKMCALQVEKMEEYLPLVRFMTYLGLKSDSAYEYVRDMVSIVRSLHTILCENELSLTMKGINMLRMFDATFMAEINGMADDSMKLARKQKITVDSAKFINDIETADFLTEEDRIGLLKIVSYPTPINLIPAYYNIWIRNIEQREKRKRLTEIPIELPVSV